MSRGFPSMTALLGLLAVAGYQNRDKLAELLGGLGSDNSRAPGQGADQQQGGLDGLLGSLGVDQQQGGLGGLLGSVGAGGLGGLLGGGLSELMENFKQHGQGEAVESWVGKGPNREIAPEQLEQAIGPDVLATLSQQTGLSREDIVLRLSTTLPEAVDKCTPDGRLPGATAASIY
jgi:uncharacterized protein YidB (DUF937 family)